MVGVVVLVGLIGLAWMMAEFGSKLALPFQDKMMPVRFHAARADGLSQGSGINYRGVTVGRVENVVRDNDQIHVWIDASVDAAPPLPANVQAVIRTNGFVGNGASLVLELTDATPSGQMKPDQQIEAKFVGLDLIPPEATELVAELRTMVKQFREANVVAHVDAQVQKVGTLLDSVNSIVSDNKLHDDLKASLANIRETTERAKAVSGKFDTITSNFDQLTAKANTTVNDISKQTTDRMNEVSKLLATVQGITEKVNNGQGTAGQLINDPKLYQSLVDTTRELNATVVDLKRLVEQWEQEGVSLKLK